MDFMMKKFKNLTTSPLKSRDSNFFQVTLYKQI